MHDRVEQLNHILELLTHDLAGLRPHLGDRAITADPSADEYSCRRSYVRASFALFEALAEQYARLLLDLHERRLASLDDRTRTALTQVALEVTDQGNVRARPAWLPLDRKLRLLCRAASAAMGQDLAVRFDDGGWRSFRAAQATRHSITHPKTPTDCYVEGDHLDEVDEAGEWFAGLHAEFLRVVRDHQRVEGW